MSWLRFLGRCAGWLVVTALVARPARAADEQCPELMAELKLTVAPVSTELKQRQKRLEAALAKCPARSVPWLKGYLEIAALDKEIAKANNATSAAPEAAASATPAKARAKAAPARTPQKAAPTKGGPAKAVKRAPPAPQATPSAQPAPKSAAPAAPPTESALLARRALDATKKSWETLREELTKSDPDRRRQLVPLYVSAALTYGEALVLWGGARAEQYAELLAPLVAESEARVGVDLATSNARIRQALNDPETSAQLEAYIRTSARLGKKVAPERSAAIEDALSRKFSNDVLTSLVEAWGHQHAEELTRELDTLASVGERLKDETQHPKQLLVVLGASQADPKCATSLSKQLESELKSLYGARVNVVQSATSPTTTREEFERELRRQLRAGACPASGSGPVCDGVLGVLIRVEAGVTLTIGASFVPNGQSDVFQLTSPGTLKCGDDAGPGEAALLAGDLFKSLLEQVSAKHRSADIFGQDASRTHFVPTPLSDAVPFGCGSFALPLPEGAFKQEVVVQNDCSPPIAEGLTKVFTTSGFKARLGQPGPGEVGLTLTRTTEEEPLGDRCQASLKIDGQEYLSAWARILAQSEPANRELDDAKNLETGDRLGMCLSSYYLLKNVPVPVSNAGPRKRSLLLPALLAPGSPLLLDEQPNNDWAGYTWIGVDSAALLATAGFALLSVDRRNSAAASEGQDLSSANAWLNASLISGAIFLASRVTSVAVFGFRDSDVRKDARRAAFSITW